MKFTYLAIYIILSYDDLFDIKVLNHLFGTRFGEDHGDHVHHGSTVAVPMVKWECKYDKVGVDLITLITTETVVLVFKELIKAFLLWILKGKLLHK